MTKSGDNVALICANHDWLFAREIHKDREPLAGGGWVTSNYVVGRRYVCAKCDLVKEVY